MFKKFRLYLGKFVGAVIAGPIAGVLAALFYDNVFTVSPVVIATGLSAIIVAIGCISGGFSLGFALITFLSPLPIFAFIMQKELLATKSKRLNDTLAKKQQEHEPDKKLEQCKPLSNEETKKAILEMLNNNKDPTIRHTPVFLGLKFGFRFANYISKSIAGEQPAPAAVEPDAAAYGRIYNIIDMDALERNVTQATNNISDDKFKGLYVSWMLGSTGLSINLQPSQTQVPDLSHTSHHTPDQSQETGLSAAASSQVPGG